MPRLILLILAIVPACAPFAPDVEAERAIPSAIQGRWGLSAADCTTENGDAKGLLVIGPETLEFYESRGTLSILKEADPTRIMGSFDFTGEGQQWQRDEVLDVQDEGRTLIRREYGDDALPGPFRYQACG